MEWLTTFGVMIGGGLLLAWFLQKSVLVGGKSLRSKFQAAGEMRGKTKSQITALVGPPQHVSTFSDGSIVQWQATGYHIVLVFDPRDVCLGVQSEYTDREL